MKVYLVPLIPGKPPTEKIGPLEHGRATVIGRGPLLNLTDDRVSRSQAELRLASDGYTIHAVSTGLNASYLLPRGHSTPWKMQQNKPMIFCHGDQIWLVGLHKYGLFQEVSRGEPRPPKREELDKTYQPPVSGGRKPSGAASSSGKSKASSRSGKSQRAKPKPAPPPPRMMQGGFGGGGASSRKPQGPSGGIAGSASARRPDAKRAGGGGGGGGGASRRSPTKNRAAPPPVPPRSGGGGGGGPPPLPAKPRSPGKSARSRPAAPKVDKRAQAAAAMRKQLDAAVTAQDWEAIEALIPQAQEHGVDTEHAAYILDMLYVGYDLEQAMEAPDDQVGLENAVEAAVAYPELKDQVKSAKKMLNKIYKQVFNTLHEEMDATMQGDDIWAYQEAYHKCRDYGRGPGWGLSDEDLEHYENTLQTWKKQDKVIKALENASKLGIDGIEKLKKALKETEKVHAEVGGLEEYLSGYQETLDELLEAKEAAEIKGALFAGVAKNRSAFAITGRFSTRQIGDLAFDSDDEDPDEW